MTEEERVQIRDARKRCFFILDNVIVDHYASIIGPFPTLVYTALCRHADYSTRETYPSHDFLAKELAISRASVKRAISTLIQHRLIERKHRKSKSGDPDTNIYIILEPWGRVSQTLPTSQVMLSKGNIPEEVGSHRTEVGSIGTEGRVSQNLGVGSVRATNNTHIEQDSGNKKEDTPLPPKRTKGYADFPGFCQLWEMAVIRPTGSKGNKQESLQAWKIHGLETNPSLAEEVLRAYAYQKTTAKWHENGGEYVPELQRWLKPKRWEGVTVPEGFDRNRPWQPTQRAYETHPGGGIKGEI